MLFIKFVNVETAIALAQVPSTLEDEISQKIRR